MPREKKQSKNFSCKLDAETFERLDQYAQLSGQSKTTVVERAINKYLDQNFDRMREFSKQL